MPTNNQSSSVAKTLRAIPKTRQAQFSYKPQCETCVANTFCMGCSFPGCTYCYESRCDTKRDRSHAATSGPTCYCEVRCKSNTALDNLLNSTKGLYPGPVHLRNAHPMELPRVIPIVKSWISRVTPMYSPRTYMIPINAFLSTKNTVPESVYNLKQFFPEGSQLILSFCVEDKWLENIWTGTSRMTPANARRLFWRQPWFDQFDAVLGVNFSVYWADPQMEINYAIKRTMVTTQEMDDAGINVIPLVIWWTDKEAWPQLDCYVKNGIDTIAINFQYVAGAQVASYKHDMQILEAIAKAYPNLRVICYGLSAPYVIDEARLILGTDRLTIVTGFPYIDAVRNPVADPLAKKEIFTAHLRRLERLVREGADPSRDFMRDIFKRDPETGKYYP